MIVVVAVVLIKKYRRKRRAGKAAQQPLTGDLILLLPESLQCGGIAGAALAALTPAELVAAIGALAFSGAQHAAAGVLAFFVFLYFLHTH